MRQKNINRLVWNNSFSNDKRIHANKEAYTKQCKKCHKSIWVTPNARGWDILDKDGKPHSCKKPKKLKESKSYTKECNRCGKPIRMVLTKGKWVVREPDGGSHRCEKFDPKIAKIISGTD